MTKAHTQWLHRERDRYRDECGHDQGNPNGKGHCLGKSQGWLRHDHGYCHRYGKVEDYFKCNGESEDHDHCNCQAHDNFVDSASIILNQSRVLALNIENNTVGLTFNLVLSA